MNQLEVFQNAEFGSVRVVVEDGVPYFVGKDVADVLGYSNSRKALLDHVDEEDKDGVTIRDAIGRDQNAVVINESGLYSLILSSKMPNAKKFKRWVTNEVLPSIRQHGVFATDSFIKKSIEDPAWAISVLKELQAKNEQIAIQAQQISELQPKANYYDVVELQRLSDHQCDCERLWMDSNSDEQVFEQEESSVQTRSNLVALQGVRIFRLHKHKDASSQR